MAAAALAGVVDPTSLMPVHADALTNDVQADDMKVLLQNLQPLGLDSDIGVFEKIPRFCTRWQEI